jgi:hypothetical protein
MYKGILVALTAAVAATGTAQTAPKPDPADPKARAPSVEYRSAFSEYRPYAEPELASWRDANEEVASSGSVGHGAAGGEEKTKQPAKTEKPAAKPPAHEGHK